MAKTREELDTIRNDCIEVSKKLRELSEEELSAVTGGSFYSKEYYGTREAVQFVHQPGDIVEVSTIFGFGTTVQCRISEVKIVWDEIQNSGAPGMPGTAYYNSGYVDMYYCEELEYHWHFPNGWKSRNEIEK